MVSVCKSIIFGRSEGVPLCKDLLVVFPLVLLWRSKQCRFSFVVFKTMQILLRRFFSCKFQDPDFRYTTILHWYRLHWYLIGIGIGISLVSASVSHQYRYRYFVGIGISILSVSASNSKLENPKLQNLKTSISKT